MGAVIVAFACELCRGSPQTNGKRNDSDSRRHRHVSSSGNIDDAELLNQSQPGVKPETTIPKGESEIAGPPFSKVISHPLNKRQRQD